MASKAPSYDIIYEALLEMHFHSAIISHFSNLYGANFLKLLKPSPQQEAWVGFDQGWVNTSVTTSQLFNDLQTAIQSGSTSVNKLYIGYFMQFKVVRKFKRRSRFTPNSFTSPYFRAELDLAANKTTGISQHETLMRLSNIPGAAVCYACGMLFDLADLYIPPDLGKLRCVTVPPPINLGDDDRHFIAFRNETDANPKWCSEPVDGQSLSFDEWASPNSRYGPQALPPQAILDLIKAAAHTVSENQKTRQRDADPITSSLPESFTLIELEK